MAIEANRPARDAALSPAIRAFDRLAPRYNEVCQGEILSWMRDQVHAALARSFPPGSRLLEIGCGAGIDTLFLAARGIEVVASDPSAGMLEAAQSSLRAVPARARVRLMRCGLEELDERLAVDGGAPARFDGIFSNFGALNCVERLDGLARLAATRLRPGGRLLLCLMGRLCAWEIAYFLVRGRPRTSLRRLGAAPVMIGVEGIQVPTFYHRPGRVMAALGSGFALRQLRGLPVLVPPPYLEARWLEWPDAVRRALAALEVRTAHRFPLNRAGDHFLMEIARR